MNNARKIDSNKVSGDFPPKSYKPRTKPALLRLAEERRKETAMSASSNVLEGIRHIAYGNPSAVCFIGSVMALMDYLGDPVDISELFSLSGVALCFPWKFGSCCDEVSIIPEIPQRTFHALGYEYEYLYEHDVNNAQRRYSKEFYKAKIVKSINGNRPVLGFGFTHKDPFSCLICGYECGGERLLLRAYWSPDGVPTGYETTDHYYTVDDWYDKCYGIVVLGEKERPRLTGEQALRFICESARILRDRREISIQGQPVAVGFNAFDELAAWLLCDEDWKDIGNSHDVFLAPCGILLLGHYRSYLYAYLNNVSPESPAPNYSKLIGSLLALCESIGGEDSQLHLDRIVSEEIDEFGKLKERRLREMVASFVQRLKEYDRTIFDCLEQLPKDYGPHMTPVIIRQVQNADKAYAPVCSLPVKAFDSGFYVDGFPVLRWGKWQDCAYGGAVTAILNAMGIGATYEQVMGLCGACYRISMLDNWDPSAAMPQNGIMAEEVMNRAFGVDVYSITDEAVRDANVLRSLEAGVPVLACGQRAEPEWTVITGYARRGGKALFFGRTYFDYETAEQDEVFTGNGYRLADRYPGEYPQALLRFYNQRCQPLSPLYALKNSLEMCIAIYEQASSQYGHRFGENAYDILIRGFELSDEVYAQQCGNDQYHIGSLMDARRAACIFLEQSADLLAGGSQVKLKAVSALYRDMTDALLATVPYEKTCAVFTSSATLHDGDGTPTRHHFPPVSNSAPVWDGPTRGKLVDSLHQVVKLEREVRVLVHSILEDWN